MPGSGAADGAVEPECLDKSYHVALLSRADGSDSDSSGAASSGSADAMDVSLAVALRPTEPAA